MRNKIFVTEDFKFDLQRFDSAFGGGDGSANNPYQIASVEDLQQLANDVNGGNTYYGKFFIVTENIDLSVVDNWQPIGSQITAAFAGTFDGNNSEYTISNMKIDRTAYSQGLFAYNTGTIKNVTLLNVDITRNNANNIGGLVGYNGGTVSGCTVTGNIGGQEHVGGVVGLNYSTLTIVSYNTFHSNANVIGRDNSKTTNNKRQATTTGIKSRALRAQAKIPTARLTTQSARRLNLRAFPKSARLPSTTRRKLTPLTTQPTLRLWLITSRRATPARVSTSNSAAISKASTSISARAAVSSRALSTATARR